MLTLMNLIGVVSRPCWDRLINFMVMPTSMQPIDVINYFQPKIVNQFSIIPCNIFGNIDVKDS
jgi:hypothetical protein